MDITMAMQAPPPAKGMGPQDYYNTLTSQGMRPWEAYNAVQANFGPPKTPQQQAEDQASADQKAQLAQTAGTVGGLIGTNYLLGQIGAGGAGTVATPTLVGAKIVGGTAGAGTATGATGASTVGGTTATGTGSTLSSVGSVALPVAVGAAVLSNAWETGMKDILRGRGNREDWTNQGINATGIGTIANIGLGLMGKRSIGKMMTTGKSDAQLQRDDFRGLLKETGVADDNYNVTLADGSQFNIGLDGKTKYQNVGENVDGKKTRNAWDVDFSNPLAKFAVDKIDPMIRSIYKDAGDAVKPEQYTGMFVNAVTSNAKNEKDVMANINAMLSKSTFAQRAGIATPPPPTGKQVIPPVKTPQVSTPEGKEKSRSIRDVLQLNMKK